MKRDKRGHFVSPVADEPEAVQFFHKHAGWSYDPKRETRDEGRLRCARELAEAERRAGELGLTVEWDLDLENLMARVPDPQRKRSSLASLGNIHVRKYRRVVEVELFSEALDALAQAPTSPNHLDHETWDTLKHAVELVYDDDAMRKELTPEELARLAWVIGR